MPLQAVWALCLGGGPDLPGFSVAYTSLKLAWRKHGKSISGSKNFGPFSENSPASQWLESQNSWDHNLFDGLRASNLSSHMGDMPNIAQPVAP